MMSKVQIIRPGDSGFLPMDMVDRMEIRLLNEKLREEGKQPARFIEMLLGVTKASLNTESWLSASSFQHTIKVLAGAAIAADQDPLFGLKENVIIGKLIPSGTGFSDKRIDTINAMVEVNETRFDQPAHEEGAVGEATPIE
jgi:DNA-directed RNA polymerase subunit beta'